MTPNRRAFVRALLDEMEARGAHFPITIDEDWLHKWFNRACDWQKHGRELIEFTNALEDDRMEEE